MQNSRKFAACGNVIDLIVGVTVGTAFGKIVDLLVNDLIMPLTSRIVGKLDFSSLFIQFTEAPVGIPCTLADLKEVSVPVLVYDSFITVAINSLILMFIVFLMMRVIVCMIDANPPVAPAETLEDIQLLRGVRDSLKDRP